MSPQAARNTVIGLAKLILIGMCVQLLVILYVFYQSYEGRVDVVTTQRAGCERAKLDRNANARGWRIAQRRAASQGQPQFADLYAELATDLEVRGRIHCSDVFPKASFLP